MNLETQPIQLEQQEIIMQIEPLLQDNPNRFVIFPIKYQDLWEYAIKHREAFWNESEIDLSRDKEDWNNLTESEQHFVKHVLAFFAASDGIVLENLVQRFYNDVQIPEVRSFYTFQMAMETIHSITYSILLDTYVSDAIEKSRMFKAIETIPSITKKAEWAQKWIASTDNFATRLIAFACVEGIFFSGSFCCIYWLKERGVLPGLCQSNDLISRDEGLHCDFAVCMYTRYIQNKLSTDTVHNIVKEAVEIETEFINESIPCRLIGMNADKMTEYIQFVANRLVKQLGYKQLYPDAKQPFSFMDRICFSSKNNFFERMPTQYRVSVKHEEEFDFTTDVQF
jgi:ribonucleotide reductase beta subunit family protein with ferritin-like domain